MGWGNSLEENRSLGRIDVKIHPLAPCSKRLLESKHTIHVLANLCSLLDVIPSDQKKKYIQLIILIKPKILLRENYPKMLEIKNRKEIVRLRRSPSVPPMPCVEDEHVHSCPSLSSLNWIKFQDSSNVFSHNVYQIHIPIEHNLDSIIL